MSDYHRVYLNGGTYFFTVVTYMRYPVFRDETAIKLLKNCFTNIKKKYPFSIDAIVIMPDHLHTIWSLPDNDSDYSKRWQQIKSNFSRHYIGNKPEYVAKSIIDKREKGIWQRRFWEHVIHNQEDFNSHCDYIHYNPVKHGVVDSPSLWKHSSFNKFMKNGLYGVDWGKIADNKLIAMDLE